jgi:hypothetical protein
MPPTRRSLQSEFAANSKSGHAHSKSHASPRSSERYVMIRIVTWSTWLRVFGWACAAHASPVAPVDPLWSADRIARLPREIRERVLSACGPHARAGHYFATYDPRSDTIHLDYTLLECPDLSRSGGGIGGFHQTFVRRAARYVLSRSQRETWNFPGYHGGRVPPGGRAPGRAKEIKLL